MKSVFEEENSPYYRENVSINYFVSYVKALSKLKEKSKSIRTVDSKLYYKLRHNLLKTYATAALGMESYQEKPFSDFEILGIDSQRTPDLIYVSTGKAFLMEFTVATRYDSVVKTKEFFSKYDTEVSQSRIPISSYYVYLTLDSDASEAIFTLRGAAAEFGIQMYGDIEAELGDVLDTIKSVTAYISDYMPEVLSMNVDSVYPKIEVKVLEVPPPFTENSLLLGKKSYKSQRVRSLLVSSIKRLSLNLKRRMLDTTYRIKVNFTTRNVYFSEDPYGLRKHEMIDLLDTNSTRLLDVCDVLGDVYEEDEIFEKYYADVDINLDDADRTQDFHVVSDTSLYESRLQSSLQRYEMSTLVDCPLEVSSNKVADLYMESMANLKEKLNPVPKVKSPFIFYPCDIVEKGPFNLELSLGTDLTDTILRKAKGCDIPREKIIERNVNYEEVLRFEKDSSLKWRELRVALGAQYAKYNKMPMKKLKSLPLDDHFAQSMISFRETRSMLSKLVSEPSRRAYSNRMKINLKVESRWDLETTHFASIKNQHYCMENLDYGEVETMYRSLLSELFSPTPKSVSDDIYSNTDPLGGTLADFCSEMRVLLDSVAEPFKTTRLAHSLQTISQMSYSLMYYSNIKLNKDDFVYDNLGNSKTLLIVKGGKTIRRTKVSRFFRMILPVTETQASVVRSSSNTIFCNNGQFYLLTPWRMLRFEYLKKGVELFHSYSSYYISSSLESGLGLEDFNKFMSIKTLMLFFSKEKSGSLVVYIEIHLPECLRHPFRLNQLSPINARSRH